jgi:hypothetical protein
MIFERYRIFQLNGKTKRQLSPNKLIVEKRTAATTGAPDTAFSSPGRRAGA